MYALKSKQTGRMVSVYAFPNGFDDEVAYSLAFSETAAWVVKSLEQVHFVLKGNGTGYTLCSPILGSIVPSDLDILKLVPEPV